MRVTSGAALDAIAVLTVSLFCKQLLAVCFGEEFARVRGMRVEIFYLLLLCLVGLTVVVLQGVGLIPVLALPAAIAAQYFSRLFSIMLAAVVLGMLFTGGGLALSYGPDLPAGSTIILVAGVTYLCSQVAGRLLCRTGFRPRKRPAGR